jgi:hypothetical protein
MTAKRTTPKTTKTPAARKPALRRKRARALAHEEIATRAYYLHLEGGSDPLGNWLRAEQELAAA